MESPRRVGSADDRVGVGLGYCLRHRPRALGEAGPFEDAHRAVPEDRPRPGDLGRESLARLRADVQPEPTVGERVVGDDLRLGVLGELCGCDHVTRKLDLEAERVRDAQLFGHLAADQDGVRLAAEVAQDAELVLDLRAARDEHEGPLDVDEQLSELGELALEEQPRVGRQQLRDADRRRVRAVDRAERVLDEQLVVVREPPREVRIVRRLARVEARVLEHVESLVGEKLAQAPRNRGHRESGV